MILVIGNTPQKVELKDLGDYIYTISNKKFLQILSIIDRRIFREKSKKDL